MLRARVAAIETRTVSKAAAIIHVSGEREQREILAIHIVLEVENFREPGAGNLRLVP